MFEGTGEIFSHEAFNDSERLVPDLKLNSPGTAAVFKLYSAWAICMLTLLLKCNGKSIESRPPTFCGRVHGDKATKYGHCRLISTQRVAENAKRHENPRCLRHPSQWCVIFRGGCFSRSLLSAPLLVSLDRSRNNLLR